MWINIKRLSNLQTRIRKRTVQLFIFNVINEFSSIVLKVGHKIVCQTRCPVGQQLVV